MERTITHNLAKFDSRKNYFDGAGQQITGCTKIDEAIKLAELDFMKIKYYEINEEAQRQARGMWSFNALVNFECACKSILLGSTAK